MNERVVRPRIVCAANQYSDPLDVTKLFIVIGARHWDSIMRDHFRLISDRVERKSEIQGFIDQFGNFYTRQEAFVIADANNQIIRRVGGDNGKLFSENLY